MSRVGELIGIQALLTLLMAMLNLKYHLELVSKMCS